MSSIRGIRRYRPDWWSALGHDARYAVRGLRRSPAFTIGVVVTLALGIGANSAVFTLVDRLLLRAPPHVADADHLRRVHVEIALGRQSMRARAPMSFPEFRAIRDGVKAFDGIAAFNYPDRVALGRGVDAPRLKRSRVTGEFFRVLGVRPELGRLIIPDDDSPTISRPAAVLGYAFWRRQFDGRRDVLGKALVLDGREFVIVGVTPKGFSGAELDASDVWVPLAADAAEKWPKMSETKLGFGYHVIARLRNGETDERVAAQASVAIRPAYEGTFFAKGTPRVRFSPVIPGRRLDNRNPGISISLRLAGAAAIVLLIACANVANLLVARAVVRRRELALRLALGVGRARLVGQLLTESILLALIAGVAALFVAVWGGSALRTLIMPDVTWAYPLLDGRIFAFASITTLLVGFVAGIAPAIQSTNPNLAGALKSGWRDPGKSRSVVRSSLLLTQAAFSVILLVGAGLFARSLRNAHTLDLGFDIDHTMLADVRFEGPRPSVAENDALFADLAERVRHVPGVAQAGVAAAAPFYVISFVKIWLPGRDSLPPDLRGPFFNAVAPEFFSTMRVRVIAGRAFTGDDRESSPRVALVNSTMARGLWPNESPIGHCIRLDTDTAPCTTVVGVIRDVQSQGLREEPVAQYYVPIAQTAGISESETRFLVVRATDDAGDVREVARRVHTALRGSRPNIDELSVRPMLDLADPEIRPFRLGATMFGVFGILSLLLASVGLYAVISFGVTHRTRELGIRTALGARSEHIVQLVVAEGVRVTLLGTLIGVVLALGLGRVVEGLLFNASPRDPVVFAVVAATLILVSVVASSLPAWRATRVDPLTALRED